jgi:Fructose-2,6-bisphosphatase
MRLYFVRHGKSEANTRHIISNRESPLGLTSSGKRQAHALANRLRDVPFSAMFCSPVYRARETADILATSFGIPYEVTESLREYDCGILEDRSDEESWRLHREYFEDWTLRHNYTNKPERGECFLDIRDRFLPFIESLKRREDEHILLIGHGGLFHLMLPLLFSNVDNDFVSSHGLGHTDCVIGELLAEQFVCRQWGDEQF